MKKQIFSLALVLCATGFASEQATGGPMNAEWFYGEGPYQEANELHQNREWQEASYEYGEQVLVQKENEYDAAMARINMAACDMAQGNMSLYNWKWFDQAYGIPDEKRIKENDYLTSDDSVLIKSDKIGIGDIVHFFTAVGSFKEKRGSRVIFSVRNFLKGMLAHGAKAYGIELIGEEDEQTETDFQTHLISLMGHLNMLPNQLSPEAPFLTAGEKAVAKALEVVEPILQEDGTVGIVFLGENRQATLIGGKQLPRNSEAHGRHISSEAVAELLKKKKRLKLIDCGTKDSRVKVTEDLADRVIAAPAEEEPFDTLIALGMVMSKKNKEQPGSVVGFGADNGPTNVFSRSLTKAGQEFMAFIIPNPEEYDMRMEGEGSCYKQMLSNCWVYKSKSPSIEDQADVIELAYDDMTTPQIDYEELD